MRAHALERAGAVLAGAGAVSGDHESEDAGADVRAGDIDADCSAKRGRGLVRRGYGMRGRRWRHGKLTLMCSKVRPILHAQDTEFPALSC